MSIPRAGAEITVIEDIGDVAELASADLSVSVICDVENIGVPALDCYRACLKCKARVEPPSPHLEVFQTSFCYDAAV